MNEYNLIYRTYIDKRKLVAGVWFIGTTENIFEGDHHHILFSEQEIEEINKLDDDKIEEAAVTLARTKL
jgi:hypothetical protein